MMNEFIRVPVVSKTGKELGEVRLNLSRVLYFRDWVEDGNSIVKQVAFLDGGKELIIKLTPVQLDEKLPR